ncbi:hypothetical protein MYAM1_001340 [Malassezia yamatoensis]|uniref:BSD domain-containing protein n=1 Tax=Malassezia yamatoensis TaxID=253288 RepID=A0AAJ5YR69_9BASI|nr:hypothetical protein MYAM1_001340 [Malassezia yamatoensis]
MADEAFSATSAAVVEPTKHPETDVDAMTRKIEDEVTSAFSGLSSWWSSMNKQSQSKLKAARSHVEEQGGFLAYVKQGVAKIDESMEQSSQQARARNRNASQPVELGDTFELADEPDPVPRDKGKGVDRQLEADTSGIESIKSGAWASLQRLAHLPKVQQLQDQLANVTHSNADSASTLNFQRILQDAEALVSKYVHDGEKMARDVSQDLRGLLDDVVRVVPPDQKFSAYDSGKDEPIETQPALGKDTSNMPRQQIHTLEDPDDFVWDDDEIESEPVELVERAMAPVSEQDQQDDRVALSKDLESSSPTSSSITGKHPSTQEQSPEMQEPATIQDASASSAEAHHAISSFEPHQTLTSPVNTFPTSTEHDSDSDWE